MRLRCKDNLDYSFSTSQISLTNVFEKEYFACSSFDINVWLPDRWTVGLGLIRFED